jgi:Family of unknown function (DUF5681)
MPSDDRSEYKVGYKKPPHHTRFRKGHSGNPRGRMSGSANLETLLRDALNEPIIVTENGGRRKITKCQAMIKQLVNQSATADWRAIKILLDLLREIERQAEPTPAETASFSAADEKVLAQLRERFSQSQK